MIQRGFCKDDCGDDDILVQTSGSRQTNGRYSVKHEIKGSPPVDLIDVGISNMNLNDSGRYSCFWKESSGKRSYSEFMAEITDGDETDVYTAAAGEDFNHSCLFLKSGNKKSFCRNTCSEENMLMETTGDSGRSGRYSLQYTKYAYDLSFVYDKEFVYREARKQQITHDGQKITFVQDFSAETVRVRKGFQQIIQKFIAINAFRGFKYNPCQLRILHNSKIHLFSTPREAEKFYGHLSLTAEDPGEE
ncbi:hypothetical protein WMY93_014199 [Mugilogobius chulae]|uniref:Uncharacterized protein n=1 Tax=Mugilogobius chulae TaxID=88201 RepID=A0AAW0P5X0_9GOBI